MVDAPKTAMPTEMRVSSSVDDLNTIMGCLSGKIALLHDRFTKIQTYISLIEPSPHNP